VFSLLYESLCSELRESGAEMVRGKLGQAETQPRAPATAVPNSSEISFMYQLEDSSGIIKIGPPVFRKDHYEVPISINEFEGTLEERSI